MKILALNPGSTSTKVALFEDHTELWSETQRYDTDVIGRFSGVMEQEEFREGSAGALHGNGRGPDAVVGRTSQADRAVRT